MTTKIGTLAALLTANITQFQQGMAGAEAQVLGLTATTAHAQIALAQSAARKETALRSLSRNMNRATADARAFSGAIAGAIGVVSRITGHIGVLVAAGYGVVKLTEKLVGLGDAARIAGLNVRDPLLVELERVKKVAGELNTTNILALEADEKRLAELTAQINRRRALLQVTSGTDDTDGDPNLMGFSRRKLFLMEKEAKEIRERMAAASRRARALESDAERKTSDEVFQEWRNNWLGGVTHISDLREKRERMIADIQQRALEARWAKEDELRQHAADMQARLDHDALDAAGRLRAVAAERLKLVQQMRTLGSRADIEAAAALERSVREALERGLEALREVEPAIVTTKGTKSSIEALVRGGGEAAAFAHRDRAQATILKETSAMRRHMASVDRKTRDVDTVAVNF
jgi:hypothetical protein